ncbi:MAG: hypothetical protein PHU85_19335 [Phycisphaerae bacterium]|nr:hypothetical protein [Phycisphaerae bacterium]
MSYQLSWTHQDANGHVQPGEPIHAADIVELRAAIDRRLKVVFDPDHRWPMELDAAAGDWISCAHIEAIRDGFAALVPAASYFVHDAGWWQDSVWARWLCPRAGGDEDKIIVPDARPPGAGELGFFAAVNGGEAWTGSPAGAFPAAVYVNEPRDATLLLTRGRYIFRAGDGGGAAASKDLPEGLWYPPAVARDGNDELHSWFGGRQWLWPTDGAGGYLGPRGQGLTVRSATMRLLPEGRDLKVKLWHCRRNVNPASFSWTQFDADAGLSWSTPGGTGAGDATQLASLDLVDSTWTELTGLTPLLQQMFDGDIEPTFMLTPDEDTGWPDEPTHVQVELVVDFDLDGPPL